ncbi:haloacid dehalogenase [Cellulomonas chitinilytica]|uniref:Haloacid dehalogenase n=1 Tax=Cellulomonas chitinilytica TaxID=398759 RepID=A0A919P0D4_9CELL|nr:HAD family phosphatase [Cellulomonas chitinilytica]GIG20350.1 haloacid dehalogenase [Cellulomonas chitinilytica]
MTAPEAVVLDLGNVVLAWDPYLPFVGRMERSAVDAFFADVDFAAFNHRQDAGRSWADARAEVAERFPEHVDALDVYVEHFAETLPGPVPGTEQLVRDLLDAGVRVVGLTNWSAETFHHAGRVAPAVGLMEGVVVSGEAGLAKPDPRIFELTAVRFGLTPDRTVFADDSPANVEAAARVGFDSLVFTSADRLRADLVARGLDLPPG